MTEALTFATAGELRDWLAERHEAEDQVWVAFEGVAPGRTGLRYAAAAGVAREFGWGEDQRADVDATRYAVRFVPGAARPDPALVAERRGDGSIPVLGDEFETEFRANAEAWEFFSAQRPAYRRAAIWWVIGAAHDETKRRRLASLIETSARGERVPAVTRTL